MSTSGPSAKLNQREEVILILSYSTSSLTATTVLMMAPDATIMSLEMKGAGQGEKDEDNTRPQHQEVKMLVRN